MKKRKFNPVNFIPNQSNYQRDPFYECFSTELKGIGENERQRERLLKNSKKHINKK